MSCVHFSWGCPRCCPWDSDSLRPSQEIPHPISSPLSHQVSCLINGRYCGKAPDLISWLLHVGEGAGSVLRRASRGWLARPVLFLEKQSSSSLLVKLLSPFRKDVWESVKPHFSGLGCNSLCNYNSTHHRSQIGSHCLHNSSLIFLSGSKTFHILETKKLSLHCLIKNSEV